MNDTDPPVIVAPDGRPARDVVSDDCPRCGKGPERRRASSGFGIPHPMCGECGYVWEDEVWRG